MADPETGVVSQLTHEIKKAAARITEAATSNHLVEAE